MAKLTKVDPASISTQTFDWGAIKWYVSPGGTPGAVLTFGEVVVMPGGGHGRHNHPNEEEVLYVLSGHGEQMVDDGEPFPIAAGDTIYVPTAVYHSTMNTGWEPLRMLAIYNSGGPEQTLADLPDFRSLPPDQPPTWTRG